MVEIRDRWYNFDPFICTLDDDMYNEIRKHPADSSIRPLNDTDKRFKFKTKKNAKEKQKWICERILFWNEHMNKNIHILFHIQSMACTWHVRCHHIISYDWKWYSISHGVLPLRCRRKIIFHIERMVWLNVIFEFYYVGTIVGHRSKSENESKMKKRKEKKEFWQKSFLCVSRVALK